MRKRIICAIVVALAIVGLVALPASAYIRPALLGVTDCDTHSGTYNTDDLTFYSANITSAGTNDNCWTTFRGIAKCKVGRSQQNVRVNGPWEDVSTGTPWSRANCPNGDNLYQGGVQGSHTGDGTLSPVFWNWPPVAHATTLAQELLHAGPGHHPPLVGAAIDTCTISNFCGFWNDNYGSGYAASPPPNAHLQGGVQIFSIADDGGAWRAQEYSSVFCNAAGTVTDTCPFQGNAAWENGQLEGSTIALFCPHDDISLCYKDNNNAVDLASFNQNARDQMWVQNNSFYYNVAATDANPNGNPQPMTNPGGGSQIVTCSLGCASVGHQSWALGNTPPSGIKLSAYSTPAHSRAGVYKSGTKRIRIGRRCTVAYDWRANALAGVTAVDLEVNTCNDTIQDRTLCRSIVSGGYYYTYSGETNALETNEGVACFGIDTAVAGAIQYPDGQTWHTYWSV